MAPYVNVLIIKIRRCKQTSLPVCLPSVTTCWQLRHKWGTLEWKLSGWRRRSLMYHGNGRQQCGRSETLRFPSHTLSLKSILIWALITLSEFSAGSTYDCSRYGFYQLHAQEMLASFLKDNKELLTNKLDKILCDMQELFCLSKILTKQLTCKPTFNATTTVLLIEKAANAIVSSPPATRNTASIKKSCHLQGQVYHALKGKALKGVQVYIRTSLVSFLNVQASVYGLKYYFFYMRLYIKQCVFVHTNFLLLFCYC